MNSKPVSVIIPTYNRCDILFNTIVEFEKQLDLNFKPAYLKPLLINTFDEAKFFFNT